MLINCLRNGQLKAEWRSVKSENWDLRDGVLHNELSGRVMYGYTYEFCTVRWCARVSTKAAAPKGVCVQRSCAARGGRAGGRSDQRGVGGGTSRSASSSSTSCVPKISQLLPRSEPRRTRNEMFSQLWRQRLEKKEESARSECMRAWRASKRVSI